jgi:hypothetical protein
LLAGIMRGYEYDVCATSSIDLHIIHRINTRDNKSTHLHRAKCAVSRQSKLELKVLHGVLTQPIVRSQKQRIKSYSQSTNQPNSPANNNLQLPFVLPLPHFEVNQDHFVQRSNTENERIPLSTYSTLTHALTLGAGIIDYCISTSQRTRKREPARQTWACISTYSSLSGALGN